MKLSQVAGIGASWVGVATIVYLTRVDGRVDGLLAIICVAAAYYLSKWIILKKDD